MAPVAVSPQPTPARLSSPVVKPILKRKRTPDVPQKPVKRSRVAFEPDVEVKFAQDASEKDVALIREEIGHALRHPDGSGKEDYDQIKAYFNTQPTEDEAVNSSLLGKYLSGLISNATILTRSHADIVHSVLRHHWLAREDAFVGLYIKFLGHLVSSQGGYLHHVLKMLVENLAHLAVSAGSTPPLDMNRPSLRDRVHKALKYVLRVVPSASNSLASVVRGCFPYADESRKAHVQYVRNLLRMVEYCPELKTEVFDLITDRLMKLDVEVQVDVEDLDEDVGELLAQNDALAGRNRQQPYEDDEDLPSDDELDTDESLDEEQKRFRDLAATVEKMDALLDILFSTHASNASKTDKLAASSTFDLLLSQFRKTILRTYRSRHTQFLIFHAAQTSQEYTDRFITACLDILQSRNDTVLRVSSVAYLASFIARGARLSSATIHYAFTSLSEYADTLRRQYEPACRGPDRRKYDVYYATIQALIYIFCFRWRDMALRPRRHRRISGTMQLRPLVTSDASDDESSDSDDAESDDEVDDLPPRWPSHIKDTFTLNFQSPLNPLKVCAPEVVDEFARIAHHVNFLYIYPLLVANRRARLHGSTTAAQTRETSLDHLRGERHWQLDAYFPFDPYNLPISKRWLEGDYNFWKEPSGMVSEMQAGAGQQEKTSFEVQVDSSDDDEEGDSSEDDDDEDEDVPDDATATPESGV